MQVQFELDFTLLDDLALGETKRFGHFLVLSPPEVLDQTFKNELNKTQEFNNLDIKTLLTVIFQKWIEQFDKGTDSEKELMMKIMQKIDKVTMLIKSKGKMALAAINVYNDKFVYIQIFSDNDEENNNWEIFFVMNQDHNVTYIDLFETFEDTNEKKTMAMRNEWLREYLLPKTLKKDRKKLTVDPEDDDKPYISGRGSGGVGDRSDQDVVDRSNQDVGSGGVGDSSDQGRGSGGAGGQSDQDELQEDPTGSPNDEVPLATHYLPDSQVWISRLIQHDEIINFWISWAQWIFMFQDHATVDSKYKVFFMHYFMGLVAEKLFGIQGNMLVVKRYKIGDEIDAFGKHETHLIGDHIQAAHDTGKILIFYKNLPHNQSFKDYDELIKHTGNDIDVGFIYIGDHPNKKFCVKSRGTLHEMIKKFYGEEATSKGLSAAAAETKKGNGRTEHMMVSSDNDDSDAVSNEQKKDYEKRVKAYESLSDIWKIHTAKKNLKTRLEEKKRAEAHRSVSSSLKIYAAKKILNTKREEKKKEEERKKWLEEWKKSEEEKEKERAKSVYSDGEGWNYDMM